MNQVKRLDVCKFDFIKLSEDVSHDIFDLLNLNELAMLSMCDKKIHKQMNKIIYFKLLSKFSYKPANNAFLLKDKFEFIIEDPVLLPLFDYISDKNICIAGGYTTNMYFMIEHHKDSDIDFYVFSNAMDHRNLLHDFLLFINDNYKVIFVNTRGSSVIDIKINEFHRSLQIIYVESDNLAEILNSFDFSHCKCAWFQNHTYITHDAEYSKQKRVTITDNNPIIERVEKIKRYGLKMLKNEYDASNSELIHSYIYESDNDEMNNDYSIRIKIIQAIRETRQARMFKQKAPVLKYDIFDRDLKFDFLKKVNKKYGDVITYKLRNIDRYFMKMSVGILVYKIKARLIIHEEQRYRPISLMITDREELEKISRIKKRLFEIFNLNRKPSEHVLQSRYLLDFNENNLTEFAAMNGLTTHFAGYEYVDNINFQSHMLNHAFINKIHGEIPFSETENEFTVKLSLNHSYYQNDLHHTSSFYNYGNYGYVTHIITHINGNKIIHPNMSDEDTVRLMEID